MALDHFDVPKRGKKSNLARQCTFCLKGINSTVFEVFFEWRVPEGHLE